jgi:hypothetical protein
VYVTGDRKDEPVSDEPVSQSTSSRMEAAWAGDSFSGFVSSSRIRQCEPGCSVASHELKNRALLCPRCRQPFGSGGNRVITGEAGSSRPSSFCVMKLAGYDRGQVGRGSRSSSERDTRREGGSMGSELVRGG